MIFTTAASADYNPLVLPLTFEPSEDVIEFMVVINEDEIVEATEMFSVTFDPAPAERGVAPISEPVILTIEDDNDGTYLKPS